MQENTFQSSLQLRASHTRDWQLEHQVCTCSKVAGEGVAIQTPSSQTSLYIEILQRWEVIQTGLSTSSKGGLTPWRRGGIRPLNLQKIHVSEKATHGHDPRHKHNLRTSERKRSNLNSWCDDSRSGTTSTTDHQQHPTMMGKK